MYFDYALFKAEQIAAGKHVYAMPMPLPVYLDPPGDGTSLIYFIELSKPSREETFTNDSFHGKITYHVWPYWARFDFCSMMLGFSYLDQTTATQPFAGVYRVLPKPYPTRSLFARPFNGPTLTLPYSPDTTVAPKPVAYASEVVSMTGINPGFRNEGAWIRPVGGVGNGYPGPGAWTDPFGVFPSSVSDFCNDFAIALVSLGFSPRPHPLLADASMPTVPGNPDGTAPQPDESSLKRFVRRTKVPGIKFLGMPAGNLFWESDGLNTAQEQLRPFPYLDFVYTWYEVPAIPSIVDMCIGMVNSVAFDGYAAGTLAIMGVEIALKRNFAGRRMYDISYRVRYNAGDVTQVASHLHGLRFSKLTQNYTYMPPQYVLPGPVPPWSSGTSYTANVSYVTNGGNNYVCLENSNATTFTAYPSGPWLQLPVSVSAPQFKWDRPIYFDSNGNVKYLFDSIDFKNLFRGPFDMTRFGDDAAVL